MQDIDEFSTSDLRHTLAEAWRVVRARRWHFFFPFCVVSTLALIASPWVPRQYIAGTVIKRESDPVLTSMMGRSWTHPYGEIRGRMAAELADPEAVTKVLEELNLPSGLEKFPNGELTPAAKAARQSLANQVITGLAVKAMEASPNRDVVSIKLTLSQPQHLPEILEAVRNKYMERCRRKTGELLASAESFFMAESERCRSELTSVKREMRDFETRFPGIDPDATDPTQNEESAIALERVNLRRQISEWEIRKKSVEQLIAAISSGDMHSNAVDPSLMQTNPKYAELQGEILRLKQAIDDAKTQKGMTDEHPTIIRMLASLNSHLTELERTPATIPGVPSAAGQTNSVATQLASAKNELDELTKKLAVSNGRIDEIAERIKGIDSGRAMAAEQREPYLKLKQKAAHITSELEAWQQNVGPIRDVLRVESKNRALHFTTIREVEADASSIWPATWMILLACAGAGLVVGILVAVCRELLDRSYRTIKQLATSVSIPVIEGVNEILTAADLRRRTLQAMVFIPGAAILATVVMLACGSMAYSKLERAAQLGPRKTSTARAGRSVVAVVEPIAGKQD